MAIEEMQSLLLELAKPLNAIDKVATCREALAKATSPCNEIPDTEDQALELADKLTDALDAALVANREWAPDTFGQLMSFHEQWPENTDMLGQLTYALRRASWHKKANALLDLHIDTYPDDGEAILQWGFSHFDAGRAETQKVLDRAVAVLGPSPDDEQRLNWQWLQAHALARLNRVDEAILVLDSSIEQHPDRAGLRRYRASSLERL